ncbi:MAG: hypothetical protein Q4D68_02220 [Moraxella equi]|nr:hypothetical protein [Moraxella equi]
METVTFTADRHTIQALIDFVNSFKNQNIQIDTSLKPKVGNRQAQMGVLADDKIDPDFYQKDDVKINAQNELAPLPKINSMADLAGILSPYANGYISDEEMDNAITEGIDERAMIIDKSRCVSRTNLNKILNNGAYYAPYNQFVFNLYFKRQFI